MEKMSTRTKWIIGISAPIGLIVAGTYTYQLLKQYGDDEDEKPEEEKDNHQSRSNTGRPQPKKKTPAPPPEADEFPLRLGSKGPRVERLQIWLMRNYGWTGKITDVLDIKTEKLMKKWLKTDRLSETTYQELSMGKPVYEQSIN